MSGLTGQASVLTEKQIKTALLACDSPTARAIVLLSFKAGLRAKEIALLDWHMLCDVEGVLQHELRLPNVASKGKRGGRIIPLNPELRAVLEILHAENHAGRVIRRRRGLPVTANWVAVWFKRFYASLAFDGASSHSGRRTFITRAARKIVEAGGSMRDVQQLAGHASLTETMRYIEGSEEAKEKVIRLI